MARFALLLPREEMVEPAGRIARELEMDVVLNQSVPTERILDLMEDCRRTGADILVARGRQASILKEHTDFPVVEIDPSASRAVSSRPSTARMRSRGTRGEGFPARMQDRKCPSSA